MYSGNVYSNGGAGRRERFLNQHCIFNNRSVFEGQCSAEEEDTWVLPEGILEDELLWVLHFGVRLFKSRNLICHWIHN